MTSFRSAARPELAITASRRSAGNQLIEVRPVDCTATFVFFLGERLYGTVTAVVSRPQGANYHFTSALGVSLVKALAPQLQPLVVGAANRSTVSPQLVALAYKR